ncbi:MAG: hypothetical protein NDF54_06205 [archaeon GB-1867-035]|nr:hypothetical protein [Candidatus Culexmicrobium profundum]
MKRELKKCVPFNFQWFVWLPGRVVYGFHFVLDARAFYRPGILERITKVFSVNGVPIVHYAISFNPKTESHGVIFADFTGLDLTVAYELLPTLRQVQYVVDVKIIPPLFEGFTIDPYFFPLIVGDERAILFLRRNYVAFDKVLREKIGTAYEVMLYLAGFEIGQSAFKAHRKIAGDDPERLIKITQALYKQVAYGIMEIKWYDMDRCEAMVRIYDNFECELFKETDKPASHFIRGTMAGWFSAFFNKEVIAIETKCIAKGDPYCQFIIKPK